MAQFIKRGKRRWLVRIALGRDPVTRKRLFLNRTIIGTKKKAQAWAAGQEHDKALGTFVRPSTVTLDAWLDQWLQDVAGAKRWGARTAWIAERFLKLYVRPYLGRRRLADLGPAEIQAWVTTLATRGLAPGTRRRAFALLHAALNAAVRLRQLAVSPCTGVTPPTGPRPEMTALTPAEAVRFLAAAEGDRLATLFHVLVQTGLRPGEALALRWGDLDLEAGTLTVRRAVVRVGKAASFAEPKTKRTRTVPLAAGLVRRLKAHALQAGRPGPEALVFPGRGDAPVLLEQAVRHFKAALKRAGLPPAVRLYDLRHTAATLLLATGTPVKAVAEILGHANAAMTLNVYAHVLPGQGAAAAERVEAALAAAGESGR